MPRGGASPALVAGHGRRNGRERARSHAAPVPLPGVSSIGPFGIEALPIRRSEHSFGYTASIPSLSADSGRFLHFGRNDFTAEEPLDSVLGTVCCAPADPGWHSGWRPRSTGENLDCPLLTASATLILPVEVGGALLSLGDGHATQGDGKLCGSAIECPMMSVTVQLSLQNQQAPTVPRVVTTDRWATLGMGDTLEHASQRAAREMIDWLTDERDVERTEALTLLSLAGSLRVTQLVNGTVGPHLLFDPDTGSVAFD